MDAIRSYVYPIILSLLLLLNAAVAGAQNDTIYEKGKVCFRTNCSSCHAVHQEIYGPMLASISKKKERSWICSFIKNSQTVIHSGDPYAISLFEKFNNHVMPSFEQLSTQEIDAVLYYIEVESLSPSESLNDTDIPYIVNSTVLNGKHEFLDHCSMCHFIHKESDFAPALGSVSKRHSREWLISFIQNSQQKIKDGDPYAVHLYKAFDRHLMTKMDFLEVEEINSILDYIEFESTVNVAYKNEKNDWIRANKTIDRIVNHLNLYKKIDLILAISMLLIMLIYYSLLIRIIKYIKRQQRLS